MAIDHRERLQGKTPERMAESSPPPQQADHSFTLQAVMELQKCVGEIGGKIDGLSEKIGEQKSAIVAQGTRLGSVETALTRVITGGIVAAVLITGFSGFLWWLMGDAITGIRDSMLSAPHTIEALVPAPKPKKK